MLTKEFALNLIKDSLSSLQRGGLIAQEVTFSGDTVLLGTGTALDSIAFVTFVLELEDRLHRETNQELDLVLDKIHALNPENSRLSADTLAQYIVTLSGR